VGLLTGYQVLSSTGTVTYSGTFPASSSYTAVVATFKAIVATGMTVPIVSPSAAAHRAANW
jgi:hypothetical protein